MHAKVVLIHEVSIVEVHFEDMVCMVSFLSCTEVLFFNFSLVCSYRTNYFILIMFILGKQWEIWRLFIFLFFGWFWHAAICIYEGLGFLWKPVAILAAFMTGFSIAFLNDRYTSTTNSFSLHCACNLVMFRSFLVCYVKMRSLPWLTKIIHQ